MQRRRGCAPDGPKMFLRELCRELLRLLSLMVTATGGGGIDLTFEVFGLVPMTEEGQQRRAFLVATTYGIKVPKRLPGGCKEP